MNLVRIAMSCCCAAMLFASCSNDEQVYDAANQQKTVTVKNLNNPFEQIGAVHNELLNSFGVSMKDELDAFSKRKQVNDAEMAEWLDASMQTAQSLVATRLSISEDSASSIVNSGIDMLNLNTAINSNDATTIEVRKAIQNASSIQDLISSVCAIETSLLNKYSVDKSVEDDLIAITVLKYSLFYWEDAFTNAKNPWFNYLNATYENQSVAYLASKGPLKDLWNKVKDGLDKAAAWVSDNWSNIRRGAIVAGLSDYSGAQITAFTGNPVVIGLGAGIASIVGGLSGWAN